MAITVKIMKRSSEGRPTLYATRDFDALPVSIGRDAACSIVLEDPHKHISRFHVEVEEEKGTYWMSVVSKVNPVMVKGRRYGPGTRLTLNSGDSFDIAEYEVQILLPAPVKTPAPSEALAKGARSGELPAADDAERLFNEATFSGAQAATATPKSDRAPGPQAEETFIPGRAPKAAMPPAAPPSGSLGAFFEGAGLPYKELSPLQVDRMLRDCGAILRAAVDGIMMLLLARAEMRKEFEAEERTMVAARDNNPLKLMSDPHEAMDFLFDPAERTDGFLDPVQAVGDACEDLRSHEIALIAGMRAAIQGALRRFEPHAIETAFDKSARGFSLGSRKAKLWDLFVAQHDKLSREAQEDFSKVFGRDFMAAYQAQLRRLKGGR